MAPTREELIEALDVIDERLAAIRVWAEALERAGGEQDERTDSG